MLSDAVKPELGALLELSARLGNDQSLVQASTGNTSVKLDGVLWVKASGKWLARATREEILVPVNLADVKACVARDLDPAEAYTNGSGSSLRASVETAMHAVLPHPVVIHVHSVNTIAWAVRQDGQICLKHRLDGLRWQWIPHVASGLPLAQAIEKLLWLAPDVLVLGNHGLVVCGPSCSAAEALLDEVERRLAITPRPAPKPDLAFLREIPQHSGWCLPENPAVHALGSDPISQSTICRGVLYPCQALFLGPHVPVLRCLSEANLNGPLLIAQDSGVLVSDTISRAAYATLVGLAQVVQRIDASVPLRYLTSAEVESVLSADAYRYRTLAECT